MNDDNYNHIFANLNDDAERDAHAPVNTRALAPSASGDSPLDILTRDYGYTVEENTDNSLVLYRAKTMLTDKGLVVEWQSRFTIRASDVGRPVWIVKLAHNLETVFVMQAFGGVSRAIAVGLAALVAWHRHARTAKK